MKIKFVCVNVWNGGKLWEPLVAWLRQENPDILAIQEAEFNPNPNAPPWEQTVPSLQTQLGFPYAAKAPAFMNTYHRKNFEKGNAILSRFPITRQRVTFFELPYRSVDDAEMAGEFCLTIPRNIQQAVVQVGEKMVNVFNLQGIWGYDGKDSPRRLAMSEKILHTLGGNKNVILCGDFNVDEKSECMRRIAAQYTDIFSGERTNSFNMRQKTDPGYGTAVVDFIFVSRDLTVASHSSPDVDISDHLPLMVEFEI